MGIGFLLLGVFATPGNGCRVWEKNGFAQPQGGEICLGSFQDF